MTTKNRSDSVPGPPADLEPSAENPLTDILRDGTSRRDRSLAAVATSAVIHLSMAGAVLYASAFAVSTPPPPRAMRVIYVPPLPPPPPPAPLGVPRPKPAPPQEAKPREVVKLPTPSRMVVPREVTEPQEPVDLPEGLPTGSPDGILGGSEHGVDDGVLGGFPGGVPGAPLADIEPEIVETSVEEAKLLFKVDPEYPLIGKRTGAQGIVMLEAIIDTDGTVRELSVLRTASALLDEAAMEAVRQWRFQPGLRDGRPVRQRLTVSVHFRLHR